MCLRGCCVVNVKITLLFLHFSTQLDFHTILNGLTSSSHRIMYLHLGSFKGIKKNDLLHFLYFCIQTCGKHSGLMTAVLHYIGSSHLKNATVSII